MENIISSGSEILTTSNTKGAVTAPKTKTQRVYHIHAKGNKGDLYTVIVYKGILYVSPLKHEAGLAAITFTPAAHADVQVDLDGNTWARIDDPRK